MQAQVLFDGPSRRELSNLTKTVFVKIRRAKSTTEIAEGLEQIARAGEDWRKGEDILTSAGKLSIALDEDFLSCVSLLIKLDRAFGMNGQYETIADKIVMTARHGVQMEELREAFQAFNRDCHRASNIRLDEFLAVLVTLARSEMRAGLAGSSIAEIVNSLASLSTERLTKTDEQ